MWKGLIHRVPGEGASLLCYTGARTRSKSATSPQRPLAMAAEQTAKHRKHQAGRSRQSRVRKNPTVCLLAINEKKQIIKLSRTTNRCENCARKFYTIPSIFVHTHTAKTFYKLIYYKIMETFHFYLFIVWQFIAFEWKVVRISCTRVRNGDADKSVLAKLSTPHRGSFLKKKRKKKEDLLLKNQFFCRRLKTGHDFNLFFLGVKNTNKYWFLESFISNIYRISQQGTL